MSRKKVTAASLNLHTAVRLYVSNKIQRRLRASMTYTRCKIYPWYFICRSSALSFSVLVCFFTFSRSQESHTHDRQVVDQRSEIQKVQVYALEFGIIFYLVQILMLAINRYKLCSKHIIYVGFTRIIALSVRPIVKYPVRISYISYQVYYHLYTVTWRFMG